MDIKIECHINHCLGMILYGIRFVVLCLDNSMKSYYTNKQYDFILKEKIEIRNKIDRYRLDISRTEMRKNEKLCFKRDETLQLSDW